MVRMTAESIELANFGSLFPNVDQVTLLDLLTLAVGTT